MLAFRVAAASSSRHGLFVTLFCAKTHKIKAEKTTIACISMQIRNKNLSRLKLTAK